jgi:hypothetical protein
MVSHEASQAGNRHTVVAEQQDFYMSVNLNHDAKLRLFVVITKYFLSEKQKICFLSLSIGILLLLLQSAQDAAPSATRCWRAVLVASS